ncbi:MAG: ABC transporter ATP-binding protein/permease [Clostridiales bacterium]|nr:ABC transporter ATP-binding protein/permease [Clostridiales bacterium]
MNRGFDRGIDRNYDAKKKRDKDADRKALKWIFQTIKPMIPMIVFIIIGEAVWALFGTVTALFSKEIINSAVDKNRDRMILFLAIYITVALVLLGANALMQYINEKCRSKIEILFRNRVFRDMMTKSYPKLKAYHTGELVTRLTGDVGVISDAATSIVPQVVMMTVRLVFAMAVLIIMKWQFGVFFTVGGIGVFVISKLVKAKVQYYHRSMQQADGRMRSFWQEVLENLMVIKSFACEENSEAKSEKLMNDHYKLRMSRSKLGVMQMFGTRMIIRIGHIFAIGYGAICLFNGTMDFGTMTALTQLVNQVQQPFANMSGIMPRYYSALSSAQRLMEIENLDNDTTNFASRVDCLELYKNLDRIDIDDVTFEYDRDNRVLDECSVRINKGDFVSITGMSGIGKSTLFKVLLDIYPKLSGKAECVEKNEHRTALSGDTRKLFAYVPQGNMLFSGSIRENLLFMAEEGSVTDVDIKEALFCSCAKDFIDELPEGIDTVIGENGIGLSEGQIQRVSVARALLSKAPILLLDEATSALDENTEAALLANLKQITDRTCIIVTHKKAALEICNRHLMIKDKKILEA